MYAAGSTVYEAFVDIAFLAEYAEDSFKETSREAIINIRNVQNAMYTERIKIEIKFVCFPKQHIGVVVSIETASAVNRAMSSYVGLLAMILYNDNKDIDMIHY